MDTEKEDREVSFVNIAPDGWEVLTHPETRKIGISMAQNGHSTPVFVNLTREQAKNLIDDLQFALNQLKKLDN